LTSTYPSPDFEGRRRPELAVDAGPPPRSSVRPRGASTGPPRHRLGDAQGLSEPAKPGCCGLEARPLGAWSFGMGSGLVVAWAPYDTPEDLDHMPPRCPPPCPRCSARSPRRRPRGARRGADRRRRHRARRRAHRRAGNRTREFSDPTAHAEMLAIREGLRPARFGAPHRLRPLRDARALSDVRDRHLVFPHPPALLRAPDPKAAGLSTARASQSGDLPPHAGDLHWHRQQARFRAA